MKHIFLILMLLAMGVVQVAAQETNYTLQLLDGSDTLERPVYLTHAGDDRLFVLEQVGRVRIFQDGQLREEPFLDITGLVNDSGNEQGLLGLAFDPNYAENGYFYLDYTGSDGATQIIRYTVSDDPNIADPQSAVILMQVPQPYHNHNGGQILFGEDGYLYIGLGDGGSGGDPNRNGQNTGTLLGTILRVDVSNGEVVAPADNPFVDDPDAAPEVWAYGLRNPWRFSFDRETGDLYIADVGQNQYEEINVQAAGTTTGVNYGWNLFEGDSAYSPNVPEDTSSFAFPVAVYDHGTGCSVTGGYVYRGEVLPDLNGVYLYGDFCSGQIWSLQRDGDEWINANFMQANANISSFGEDLNGELYVLTFNQNGIWQLVAE